MALLPTRCASGGAPPPGAQTGPLHPFTQVVAKRPRYLFDELHADITSGHNVIATVFVQCGAMYRAGGPEALRPVGETEFVNGVAAMSADSQAFSRPVAILLSQPASAVSSAGTSRSVCHPVAAEMFTLGAHLAV